MPSLLRAQRSGSCSWRVEETQQALGETPGMRRGPEVVRAGAMALPTPPASQDPWELGMSHSTICSWGRCWALSVAVSILLHGQPAQLSNSTEYPQLPPVSLRAHSALPIQAYSCPAHPHPVSPPTHPVPSTPSSLVLYTLACVPHPAHSHPVPLMPCPVSCSSACLGPMLHGPCMYVPPPGEKERTEKDGRGALPGHPRLTSCPAGTLSCGVSCR